MITVDGRWGLWSSWSHCTTTCGRGVHTRIRSCSSPRPSNNGKRCIGSSGITRKCNQQLCLGNI